MLRLFLNGELFWSANINECPSPNYAIYDLKGSYKIDQLDTISFTILKTHPMFSSVRLKRATFLLHDKTVLFFGRVSELRNTYDFRTEVGCEEYFGMLKDDWFSNYYDHDYLSNFEKTEWDTANELITNIIEYYNPNHLHSDEPAGINSAWSDLPKITKGYTNFVGESANVQVFDIGGKSFYDILYSELISKCGGFFRMRVAGKLLKSDGTHVDGYQINKIYMDYLSSEDDYRIDPSTGLLYDYTSPSGDVTEIDLSDRIVEIVEDQSIIDYDSSVDVIEDPSLEPVIDDEDVPATYYYDDDPNTIYVDGAIPEGADDPQSTTDCIASVDTDSYSAMKTPVNLSNVDNIVYIDGGRYYYSNNVYSMPYFSWMTFPWTAPDWDNRLWPIYYDPINKIDNHNRLASKETVISNINDGYHKLCLYVNVMDGALEYLPKDGRIPGLYYMYTDGEDEEHIIQVKKGANWFTYKSVSANDIVISSVTTIHDGVNYSINSEILQIGRIIYSTNEFWVVDSVSDDILRNIAVNYRLLIDAQ